MINVEKIRDFLHSLAAKHINRRFFRLVLERDSVDILELWPSQAHGWRFNPSGEFGALYLSDSAEMCVMEVARHIPNIETFRDRPRILGTVDVQLHKYLDLTDSSIITKFGMTEDRILEDDSDSAIVIAREARRAGFEGILYHSVIDRKSINLALFKDCLAKGSYCKLISVEKLSFEKIKKVLSEQ